MSIQRQFKDAVHPSDITLDEGVLLTSVARKAIEHYVKYREIIKLSENIPSKLLKPGMAFVTIDK